MSNFSSRKPMKKTEGLKETTTEIIRSYQRLDSGYPETPLPQSAKYKNDLYKFPPSFQSLAQSDQITAKFLISSPCDIPPNMKNCNSNPVCYNHGIEIYTFSDERESKADAKTGLYEREDSAYFTSPKLDDHNDIPTERANNTNWQIGSQNDLTSLRNRIIIFPGLSNECSRLFSYLLWPKTCLQHLIHSFVKAGFFYTSQSDWLQCYVCGVRICDWLSHHNPLIEHARHQPHCPIVTKALENINPKHVKCVTRTVETKLIQRAQEEKFFMILMAKNEILVS